MAAGVTDRLWSIADIVNILEQWEADQIDRKTVEYLQPGL
jgi:hypothetical protein